MWDLLVWYKTCNAYIRVLVARSGSICRSRPVIMAKSLTCSFVDVEC